MYDIQYTNLAYSDLDDMISYIAKDSLSNALTYLEGFDNQIDLLIQNPYMGIECKHKSIDRDCRVLIYKSHIIVYQINQELERLLILRIFHSMEQYNNKIG